jgi:hypothetical protein
MDGLSFNARKVDRIVKCAYDAMITSCEMGEIDVKVTPNIKLRTPEEGST